MRLFVCVIVLLVTGGLVSAEIFGPSHRWLDHHVSAASLAITTVALLIAAYAAEQARRAVVQSTRFRDVDRLEDVRDEVIGLLDPPVSLPLSRALSAFSEDELPKSWELSQSLMPGRKPDQILVKAAQKELTTKLDAIRTEIYR